MPGCLTKCTTFRIDNRNNAWLDVRGHFGPRTQIGSSIHIEDMNEWTLWANDNGVDPITEVDTFGKWLIWKCSMGTTDYGNLPTRKRDHVGISCIPCPFDSSDYDEVRSEIWLGYIPTSLEDHVDHYLRVAQRGTSWGFECTYSGCPYQDEYGYPYFHA